MSLKVISASCLEGVLVTDESSTKNILTRLSYIQGGPVQTISLSDNELISLRDYLNARFPAEDIGQVVDENQLPLPFNHLDNFVTEIASAPVVAPDRGIDPTFFCSNCQHYAVPAGCEPCYPCIKVSPHPNFVPLKAEEPVEATPPPIRCCADCQHEDLSIDHPVCAPCLNSDEDHPNFVRKGIPAPTKGDGRRCRTCKYLQVPIDDPPCINCCGSDDRPNYVPE